MWSCAHFRVMDNNILREVDTRLLPSRLETLDLSNNLIHSVKYGFTSHHQLVLLDLSYNNLQMVEEDLIHPDNNTLLQLL